MHNRPADRPTDGRREDEHGEMPNAALARPGVREMMEVHGTWHDHDRALDPYRAVTRSARETKATNSSRDQ